jgi:uncharacterized lipoprotein YmbA
VKYLFTLLSILFFGGCGSSKFYHLYPTIPAKEGSFNISKNIIGVAEVKLADYIDKPQIVTQKSQNALEIREKENWAGDFAKNIQSVITQDLNRLLSKKYTFVALPAEEVTDDKYRIFISIDRFDSNKEGLVVIDGRWSIKNLNSGKIIKMREFHYSLGGEIKSKDEDSLNTLAQTKSMLLERLSRDIAKEVKTF